MATDDSSTLQPLSEDELTKLIWRELSVTAKLIARLRVVALTLVSVLVISLLLLDQSMWRLWVFGAVAAAASVLLIGDFFWLRRIALAPRHVAYLLSPIMAVHTAIIIVTGGAESPFLVLYVLLGMVPAVTIGRLKPFLLIACVPLTLLWALSVGAATGLLPPLRPDILGGGGVADPVFIYTQALVFTATTLVGGGMILVIRMVVERTARSAAVARHELMAIMLERNRELQILSAELAHELKNPLASVQGLSALVARKLPSGSKESAHMKVLIGEVKRMGTTLDEFLNFSRPLTGLTARLVSPAELLADVVSLHEGMAHQRGVKLAQAGGQGEPITCDPRKVKQVLINLLQNALDATPQGGQVAARIELGEGGSALFVIEDSGSGIAEEIRRRLFQPGTTTKPGGSGLGLTIAQAIAQQHGGSLVLEDRAGGGCRAVLSLPAIPVEGPDSLVASLTAAEQAASSLTDAPGATA